MRLTGRKHGNCRRSQTGDNSGRARRWTRSISPFAIPVRWKFSCRTASYQHNRKWQLGQMQDSPR